MLHVSNAVTRSAAERCELQWCSIPKAAVRPVRVVMPTPAFNLAPRVKQIAEPAYLQTLFTQTAVEALDVGVLDRLARPDVHQFDPLIQTPGDEAAAGELRPITVRMRCGASPRSPMTCSNAITRTLPSDLSVSKLAIVIFTCEVAY